MASITLHGNKVNTIGSLPAVNSVAPDFTLVNTDLATKTLKDFAGKNLILNIFPSVDTGVCAASVRAFNQKAANLENTVVLCISKDLPFAQKRWVEFNAGDYIKMYSDHKYGTFGKVTGTFVEELAILARASFVVDKDNTITYAEYLPEIGNEPDYDKILEEANKVK